METLEALTLKEAPARIRFKSDHRSNATQNNYYRRGQVADYGAEVNTALVLEGIAEPAPVDAPIDEPTENAMGMPPRRPQPAPKPKPPARPPEPEDEGPLARMSAFLKADRAAAAQEAAAQLERVARLDAFLASDLPARFASLEAEVAALKAKVQL